MERSFPPLLVGKVTPRSPADCIPADLRDASHTSLASFPGPSLLSGNLASAGAAQAQFCFSLAYPRELIDLQLAGFPMLAVPC